MTYPNRYIKRENGALIDGIPTTAGVGPASSGEIVATGPLGVIDVSLLPSVFGGGVTSLNTLTGAITLAGGSGVTIGASGNTITLNVSASGGSFTASGDVISSGGLARVIGFEGTPIALLSGALVDGVTWQYIGASGAWVPVFDRATRPASAVAGKPSAGQLVMIYTAEALQTYPANFAGSVGSCGTMPVSTATYSIYKNATLVGNVSISTAGVFSFSTIGGLSVTLNVGDRLTLVAPGTQDAQLADVSITFVGTRGSVAAISSPSYPLFRWRGTYSGVVAYDANDLVAYNGSSYICILPNTGQLPTNTTYWNLLAAKGTDGTSSAVQSVNAITGAVLISGGLNVWTQQIGQTVLVNASGGSTVPNSCIDLRNNSSRGSTATEVFRWATININVGSDMTLTQSSVNGDSITINTAGLYSCYFCSDAGTSDCHCALTLNASNLTTQVYNLATAQRVASFYISGSGDGGSCCTVIKLNPGDILRAHSDRGASGSASWLGQFMVTRIA